MSRSKTAKDAVKAQLKEEAGLKEEEHKVPAPQEVKGLEYGKLETITFERTISMRQFEPLRLQFGYKTGKDDDLYQVLNLIAKYNDIIDSKFHPEGPAQVDNPPSPPQNGGSYTLKNPDAPASDAQYRKMFAIWHRELGEDPSMKPKAGMTMGEANKWISEMEARRR